MRTLVNMAATAAFLVLVSASQQAAAVTILNTPDQPLPATLGDGLTGQLWINVPPTTDNIAAAEAIIAGGTADANFLSTVVDYPSGSTGSTLTSVTYADVLDAVGLATIDNTAVLTDDVLNTVMRFTGFFGVFEANETWTFQLLSDDGSALDLSGVRVGNNDGIHGFGGPTFSVQFTTPGLYSLDLIFFESQVSHWGLELRGGLNGATPTTAISERLYNLQDYADPDDPRLDSIAVPLPGSLALVLGGLLALSMLQIRRLHPTA